MRLAELLGIEHKQNSLTLLELQAALNLALTLPAVASNSALVASIRTALIAITTYNVMLKVTETLQKVKPIVTAASLAAATPLNPSAAPELAQLGLVQTQSLAKEAQDTAIQNAKEAALNIEIPGTN